MELRELGADWCGVSLTLVVLCFDEENIIGGNNTWQEHDSTTGRWGRMKTRRLGISDHYCVQSQWRFREIHASLSLSVGECSFSALLSCSRGEIYERLRPRDEREEKRAAGIETRR